MQRERERDVHHSDGRVIDVANQQKERGDTVYVVVSIIRATHGIIIITTITQAILFRPIRNQLLHQIPLPTQDRTGTSVHGMISIMTILVGKNTRIARNNQDRIVTEALSVVTSNSEMV